MGRIKINEDSLELNRYIGKRLKYYRKYKGMKIKDVSDLVGVTLNQVSLYERGKGDIRISLLMKICKVLSMPIYEVFPEQDGYEQLPDDLLEIFTEIKERKLNSSEVLAIIKNLEE